MRNQTYGDLDEARLIEGLAGEKAIYRRRGEKEPEVLPSQTQQLNLRLSIRRLSLNWHTSEMV